MLVPPCDPGPAKGSGPGPGLDAELMTGCRRSVGLSPAARQGIHQSVGAPDPGQAPTAPGAWVAGPSTKAASTGHLGPSTEHGGPRAGEQPNPVLTTARPRTPGAHAVKATLGCPSGPAPLPQQDQRNDPECTSPHSPLSPGPLPTPPAPGVLNPQQQDALTSPIPELSQVRDNESMKLPQRPGTWVRDSQEVLKPSRYTGPPPSLGRPSPLNRSCTGTRVPAGHQGLLS